MEYGLNIAELAIFPKAVWGQEPSARWVKWCSELKDYEPPQRSLTIRRKERKWELVSAYQKSVRRGERAQALMLVSAMDSMPEEWAYFHKRVATTFTEDVGPADRELTMFAIAALQCNTPKKLGLANYRLICFLTQLATEAEYRSRMYCSLSVIENKLKGLKSWQPEVSEMKLLELIQMPETCQPRTEQLDWAVKNNWRGEGMLKWAPIELGLTTVAEPNDWPEAQIWYGIPSYAYDMHTRAGIVCLAKLNQKLGVKHSDAGKLLGWALFFEEGGRIKNEIRSVELYALEQKVVAKSFGLSLNAWLDVRVLVRQALKDGTMHDIRNRILWAFYGREMDRNTAEAPAMTPS